MGIIHTIEICEKSGVFDAVGHGIKKDIIDLGFDKIEDVAFIQVYILEGEATAKQLHHISTNLLTDCITQNFTINKPDKKKKNINIVWVMHRPGVMDPVEESVLKGIRDLGIATIKKVHTAKKYILKGTLSKKEISFISEKLLYNKVIQHVVKGKYSVEKPIPPYQFNLITVDLINARGKSLIDISKKGQLFLNIAEMNTIKDYFTKLGRNPTDCELETIAQTWSEHCVHKTLKGIIKYNGKTINNLLKSTVMKATRELNKEWCVSVFEDNSGVIKFDKNNHICFKVETHNHPSALEPYGGAGTGIGGVIRDVMGTGKSGKPIMNTDIFCFAPPDTPLGAIPKGALHPKRIMKGVVSGVRDYGNRMGIPTSNGAILYDKGYLGNPLVFCGTVGIMPKYTLKKKASPGDVIVLVGGKTGRDGIHGATFSSGELTHESESVSGQAVQIGNPITEKKMVDTLIKARDLGLYKTLTDCGAGGLSSAVGEMGEETGAEVHLERVPLKYKGLSYTEIWISEAQERMVLVAEPKNVKKLISIFENENVEAVEIGRFTNTKKLHLFYNGETVCDLDMKFLHKGLPRIERKATWKRNRFKEPGRKEPEDLALYLHKILSSWNVCSKEWVIRQYDHEVQGASVLKPLQGIHCDGPGDACVIKPVLNSNKGLAVSNGINFLYGLIDPYWMAASAIDEAIRQIISVGGSLDRIAILDNFCWGNTENAKTLGSLVRASLACYDVAKKYGVPFISGKDSLNNEFRVGKKLISIPPTLLISAISIIDDVSKCLTMDFKKPDSLIYVIGKTYNEMGGSHYWKILNCLGNSVPRLNMNESLSSMRRLSKAIRNRLVLACHDCSEGGIGVSLSEMAFAGDIGVDISLKNIPLGQSIKRNDIILFSESNSRFVVEVPLGKKTGFEKIMKGSAFGLIGQTTDTKALKIRGLDSDTIIEESLDDLKRSWKKPFSKW